MVPKFLCLAGIVLGAFDSHLNFARASHNVPVPVTTPQHHTSSHYYHDDDLTADNEYEELGGGEGADGNRNHLLRRGTAFPFQKKMNNITMVTTPYEDHIFIGNVSIGPMGGGRKYKMIFDTVSSGMMVIGEGMLKQKSNSYFKSEAVCDYQPRTGAYYKPTMYVPNDDSDDKPATNVLQKKEAKMIRRSSYSFDDEYGIETMAKDSVRLGKLILNDVNFQVADSMRSETICRRGSDYDGVIGLNLEALTTRSTPTSLIGAAFFPPPAGGGSKKKKALLPKRMFSIYISPKTGEDGQVIFGGIDEGYIKSGTKMRYFPIERTDSRTGELVSDWRLKFDGLSISNKPVLDSKFVARFESTLKYGIYSPDGNVLSEAILSATPGAERVGGRVVIECSMRKDLQDLIFTINGVKFGFSGEEYFPFRSEHINNGLREKLKGNLCQLFVSENSDVRNPKGLFGIGVPFMKKYYTAYDADVGQIGIAHSTENKFSWFGLRRVYDWAKLKFARRRARNRCKWVEKKRIKKKLYHLLYPEDYYVLHWKEWTQQELLIWYEKDDKYKQWHKMKQAKRLGSSPPPPPPPVFDGRSLRVSSAASSEAGDEVTSSRSMETGSFLTSGRMRKLVEEGATALSPIREC